MFGLAFRGRCTLIFPYILIFGLLHLPYLKSTQRPQIDWYHGSYKSFKLHVGDFFGDL